MVFNEGRTLQKGKYTIGQELGRGRFGITYWAEDLDGKRWVIKILNPDLLASLSQPERDRLKSQFLQEATKLALCRGTPHIVKAEMPFEEEGIICLPIEYVDGRSLADRAQRVLPEKIALEYVRQIGAALAVVHGQNLVHRDIRPANVLLRIHDRQAEAVLIDFGLAIACDTALTRTRKNECMDGFSAIELYSKGKPVGAYTDVYSLAATLYELLTGDVPVSAYDRGMNQCELVSPQVKNPEISARTTRAILAGMALAPEKRPQSVQAWLEQLSAGSESPEVPAKKSMDWWVKLGVIVGLLGAVATLLGAVATLLAGLPGLHEWMNKPKSSPSTPPTAQPFPKNPKRL